MRARRIDATEAPDAAGEWVRALPILVPKVIFGPRKVLYCGFDKNGKLPKNPCGPVDLLKLWRTVIAPRFGQLPVRSEDASCFLQFRII
jgi:hypothetical protein